MNETDHGLRHRQVAVCDASVHVVEAGDPGAEPVVFLHGWPQSWHSWRPLMEAAAGRRVRALALDLPGVGGSTGYATDGSKRQIAEVVHTVVEALELRGATLVGHDIGGMVAYAYLRQYTDIARAVIMDIVIPGVDPWEEFLRQPFLWHFAFHAIPGLPEHLVRDRQAEYFEYFYNVLAADPARLDPAARHMYAEAYTSDSALTSGFNWFRALPRDAEENRRVAQGPRVATPLLYLRGDKERGGDITAYAEGLRRAGVANLEYALVPGAAHFPAEEAAAQTWQAIARFAGF